MDYKTFWNSLYDPKYVSRSYFFIYVAISISGFIVSSTAPNIDILHSSVALSVFIGAMTMIGGIVSSVSLSNGEWYKERAGIYFMLGGIFAEIIGTLFETDWPLADRLYYAIFSGIVAAFLLIRRYKIKDFVLNPNKKD